jgi:hypothetical protein
MDGWKEGGRRMEGGEEGGRMEGVEAGRMAGWQEGRVGADGKME